MRNDIKRYLSKVAKHPTDGGCWLWEGSVNERSRAVFHSGKKQHRAAVWYWKNVLSVRAPGQFPPLKDGEMLRHDCDNPACVTPTHLRPGTSKDNGRDCAHRFRAGGQKITWELAQEIQDARAAGWTYDELQVQFPTLARGTLFRTANGQGVISGEVKGR